MSTPRYDTAYVWLVMRGDAYVPGAVVSAYSVRRTQPAADLVVMVTADVSQHARDQLLRIVDSVREVPYISHPTVSMKTLRQRQLYHSWMNDAYTKWNALNLTEYRKILFLDADTVCVENIDHLFALRAPAGPFNSPFAPAHVRHLAHEEEVPAADVVQRVCRRGHTFNASVVVLEPSADDYAAYVLLVKRNRMFGFDTDSFSAPDETSLSLLYSRDRQRPWTNIHHRWNFVPWRKGFLPYGDIPSVLHYFSDKKPWHHTQYDAFPDLPTWFRMAALAEDAGRLRLLGMAAPELVERGRAEQAADVEDAFAQSFHSKLRSLLELCKSAPAPKEEKTPAATVPTHGGAE